VTQPDLSQALRVRILDVGQGDAIVVILPGRRRALVVDAFSGERVLSVLQDEGIEELFLFLSHSDEDHVAGVDYVLDNFEGSLLGCVFNADRLSASPRSEYVTRLRYLARATREHGGWSADFDTGLNTDRRFDGLCSAPVAAEVLHPTDDERKSLMGTTNEASGVLRISYGPGSDRAKAVLLCGDVQLTGISCLMHRLEAEPNRLRAEILKYPHHGSWPEEYPGIAQFPGYGRRTMADFLEAVDPEVTCLSVGLDNPHGHVCAEVFATLSAIARDGMRLRRVLCTQITATCLREQQLCPALGCAGDIEIRIGQGIQDGLEVVPNLKKHTERIFSLTDSEHAGCAAVQLRSTQEGCAAGRG